MSDEASSPTPLAYEQPDLRRRLSRRLARVALIASAVALLLVAQGLYAKFGPALRYHTERYAAQREVLGLATPGVGFDAEDGHRTRRPAEGAILDRVTARWERSRIPKPFIIVDRENEPGPFGYGEQNATVYLGPLADRSGEERLVSLRVAPNASSAFPLLESSSVQAPATMSTRPASPQHFPVSWLAYVRPARAFWEKDAGSPFTTSEDELIASAARLHLDPPALDPHDRRRLLLRGTADDVPFALEFMLDSTGRLEAFRLKLPLPVGD